jgi:uncharacterized protein
VPAHDGSGPQIEVRSPVVVLRPVGAPLTIGLAGLGIASLLESGLALGWLPAGQTSQVGVVLVTVPFVLQLLACVFSYLARDGAGGAAAGVLAVTWAALGLLHLQTGTPAPQGALGLLLLGSGAAISLSATTVSRTNPLAGAIFALAGARFLLQGVYELGGASGFEHAAGILGLVIVAAVAYAAPAFELEDQRQGPVLPTMRREPVHGYGEHDRRLQGLSREPGVRAGG